jgi:anti-sigma factor RsiW
MSHPVHPDSGLLHRFLRGAAPRAERGLVVRHLLAGCPECRAVVRTFWELASSFSQRKAVRVVDGRARATRRRQAVR